MIMDGWTRVAGLDTCVNSGRGVLFGEVGWRVRARQSHDLTGELRRGINVTSHGVGMLLAGTTNMAARD